MSSSLLNAPPSADGLSEHFSVELVNTAPFAAGSPKKEELTSPKTAARWLGDRGLVSSETVLADVCLGRLKSLRAAVAELLSSIVSGERPNDATLTAINNAVRVSPTVHVLHWTEESGYTREAEHPITLAVERAMGLIAADAVELALGADRDRLAVCAAPSCGRYFVRTHARRSWCSTRCGNRVRAARAYAKQVGKPAPSVH